MKPLPFILALGLAVAAGAQSPLTTNFNGGWTWVPASNATCFFDLTVNTTVTLQALDVHTSAAIGTTGTVQLYITVPGTTTHVGNETIPGAWQLAASGSCTSAGGGAPSRVCLTPGVVLSPGTYGVAVYQPAALVPVFTLGNGTNQTYSTAELTLQAGSVQASLFASGSFTPYVWDGSITYANGSVAHSCATADAYGTGCYTVHGSFYQLFNGTAAATAAALNGRSISFINTGVGAVIVPGSATYIPPSGSATSLPANDDGETAVPLTTAFPYSGGLATQLFVHTNGYVSVASNNTLPGGNNYTPTVAPFLAAPATGWWCWHDFNASEAGSGTVKFEEIGSLVLITWDNVESYPVAPTVNPGTFQFQFDTSTGQVDWVFQSLSAIGGSPFGDNYLVGYSPGGESPDPGGSNLTTLTSITLLQERFPLRLAASARPVMGNTVDLITSQETGVNVGVNFLSLVGLPAPGIDLAIIGAPGCPALVDINAGVGNVISNLGVPGLSMTISLPIPTSPPSLVGATLYSQSVWLDATANAFGILTSNGVQLVIGVF